MCYGQETPLIPTISNMYVDSYLLLLVIVTISTTKVVVSVEYMGCVREGTRHWDVLKSPLTDRPGTENSWFFDVFRGGGQKVSKTE